MKLTIFMIIVTAFAVFALWVALRSLHEDRLFSNGHRVELVSWVMLALYMAQGAIVGVHENLLVSRYQSVEIPVLLQLILLALMAGRLMALVAMTVGNPPRVSVTINLRDDRRVLELEPDTKEPGVVRDGKNVGHVIL